MDGFWLTSWQSEGSQSSTSKTEKFQVDDERGAGEVRREGEPAENDIYRQPWKYVGYKGYSQFISSENDLLIFRQFRELSVRNALRLQDKISVLEAKLMELDDTHSRRESYPINNGTFRNKKDDREAILDQIEVALNRYYKFLIRQSDMQRLQAAPHRDVKNIMRWHDQYDNRAINQEEQNYLSRDDLICLNARDKPPLRHLIDHSLRLRTLPIWRDNSRAPTQGSENITYFSEKKMNAFVSGIITVMGSAMLIIPIWVLVKLKVLETKLAAITVFVFVFLLVLSFAMVTKPFEALAATAAYAAVLMVFIM
ncbi:uncharacterized protein F4822DRAFT_403556 [Hypoxylon trugodes]|uniref:uncharacterized protein n=1 Tax=Hypoxylon trugodes TaxID=326681 RepID=UPI0021914D87|nr:uncharacterized protein F4822DRAFT_403556 [Hypoxylon trugodes]KAI1388684.1 hypothetical protein F4822DRAFT_403556 [Hypoxylon trugodes]